MPDNVKEKEKERTDKAKEEKKEREKPPSQSDMFAKDIEDYRK